ncbi:MAG TPA: glycoside hydrolase [Feifaniaceae bacterium]|nr:glycoside hydrolase [Feifaniaceae bacterium]
MRQPADYFKKHDRRKRIRTVFECVILLFAAFLLAQAFIETNAYEPPASVPMSETAAPGFVALSYFGVERYGSSDTLIELDRLHAHISALKASGYVTVTEQDIIDYYVLKKPLPEKALFLMFEDGRRDTAIFAQEVLEAYNYRAMMFSYADKLEKRDNKFLSADDLLALKKSTYWELGTNGYRLEYINVFDRYDNYVGHIDSIQFSLISQYLRRNYDHYLMDFIRDEDGVPEESYEEMAARIGADYASMQDTYTGKLTYLPRTYSLMHANSKEGYGTHKLASAENEAHLKELFTLCFNREGDSVNDFDTPVYDLTRMQPQAHWQTNHLLMRLWDDTKEPMAFVYGDAEQAKEWQVKAGAAEFRENRILITSLPSGAGRIAHRAVDETDIVLEATLNGNLYGAQGAYLRAVEDLSSYVYAGIQDRTLTVSERSGGTVKELASVNLFAFFHEAERTVAEDEAESLLAAQNAILQSDADAAAKAKAQTRKDALLSGSPSSLPAGAEAYRPETDLSDSGSYKLRVALSGDTLRVAVNGTPVLDQKVSAAEGGQVQLEAAVSHGNFSQRNLYDDVYDGVFEDVLITTPAGKTLYTNRLSGREAFFAGADRITKDVINWFIDVF